MDNGKETCSVHVVTNREIPIEAILQETTDLVGMADSQERILYLNYAGRRLIGIGKNDDVTETTISEYLPDWAYLVMTQTAIPTQPRTIPAVALAPCRWPTSCRSIIDRV